MSKRLLIAGLMCLGIGGIDVSAVPGMQVPLRQLKDNDAKVFIDEFKGRWMDGDYVLDFQMRHMPRRGPERLYVGRMYGGMNGKGPIVRVDLSGMQEQANDHVRMLIQSGSEPMVWVMDPNASGGYRRLTEQEMFEPILPGMIYSPYELMMNFIYWKSYDYEGTKRVRGRPAYLYMMHPPSDVQKVQPQMKGVRLVVDSGYSSPIKAEVIDKSDQVTKTLRVLSFKKVQGVWIVRGVDMIDEINGDKTRFDVRAALLGKPVERLYLVPGGLKERVNGFDGSALQVF